MSKKVLKTDKDFDSVKFFWTVNEKIAEGIKGMTFVEPKEHMS